MLKYVTMEFRDGLYKHMKKVRSSQASVLISEYCTELSKTQFSLTVSRKKKAKCICDRGTILFLARTIQKLQHRNTFFLHVSLTNPANLNDDF